MLCIALACLLSLIYLSSYYDAQKLYLFSCIFAGTAGGM